MVLRSSARIENVFIRENTNHWTPRKLLEMNRIIDTNMPDMHCTLYDIHVDRIVNL